MKSNKLPKQKYIIFFLVLLLILAFCIFSIFDFYTFSSSINDNETDTKAQTEYVDTKTKNNEQSAIIRFSQGYLRYLNHQANFTIDYPENMHIVEKYEYFPIGGNTYSIQGSVWFCSTKIDASINYCKTGGVFVLYGVPESDGWGGGCSPELYKEFMVGDRMVEGCVTEKSMGAYFDEPAVNAKFSIGATITEEFDSKQAKRMLESFSFVKK